MWGPGGEAVYYDRGAWWLGVGESRRGPYAELRDVLRER
jgi:hypothetical protein